MKGKIVKKILKRISILLLLFIIIVNIPLISINHHETTNNYNNWMKDNLSNDAYLVDIKMLGAHDAFSSDINYFSAPDISADSIMTGIPGTLLKGYLVKQSVTQTTDTLGLLKNGVRYFDIRLTYDDGDWVTKHNFVSSDFNTITADFVSYLELYQGEFLTLDFQHIDGLDYNNDADYQIFIKMLEDSNLLAYQYVNNDKLLGEITYGDITNNGLNSKIIIIDKFTKDTKETYSYESTIRSSWANTDSFSETLAFLKEESIYVNSSGSLDNSFKVMQAVVTTQMSPQGIINSLTTWSLIERASNFNNYLISNQDFDIILDSLPIIMIDYANSNANSFVDNVMEIIINANTQ